MIFLIEEAIKKRIAEAGLSYLRSVESYGGQIDGGLAEAVRSFPAVWVSLREEAVPRPVSTTREIWHVPATFQVMAGARCLHNEASALLGGLNIGVYQMLADIRALLLQQDFGLPIRALRPGRTTRLRGSNDLSSVGAVVFAQDWLTTYPLEVRKEGREPLYPQNSGQEDGPLRELAAPGSNPDGTTLPPLVLPPLLRVGMNYHLRPGAADDGEPDITDLITLQPEETL